MACKIGMTNYGGHYVAPPALKEQVLRWQSAHSEWLNGGPNPKPHNPACKWFQYRTIIGLYASGQIDVQYANLRTFCLANGYEFERCFLHMRENFTTRNIWATQDMFGCYENKNGVLTDNDGILKDVTQDAYAGRNVAFRTSLYIGSDLPFDTVFVLVPVNAAPLEGFFQYRNGSNWAPLNTSLTATGTLGRYAFVPPADWKRTVINGSWEKYFIRYVHSGSQATVTKVYGDNWKSTDGTHNARGWDATSPTIVNTGELAYNPTPPAHATARFKHQSRACGYWAEDYVFVNPAYEHNGINIIAAFKCADTTWLEPCDGVLFDSLGGALGNGISDPAKDPEKYSDFTDYTSSTWSEASVKSYEKIVEYVHTTHHKMVGGNTPYKGFALKSDFVFCEYANPPGAFNGAMGIADYSPTGSTICYDDLLPQHNPTAPIVLWQQQDILNHRPNNGGAFWDRANRGPMVALATHYLAANDKSYFYYYTQGGYRYDRQDEVYLWSQPTTLTQPLVRDTTINPKRIKGVDFSSFPSTGKRLFKAGNTVIVDNPNTNVGYVKIDNQTLETTTQIYYDVAAGAPIRFMLQDAERLSNHPDYNWVRCDDVYMWASYFPAMFVDIGEPDPTGWNGGQRGVWSNTTSPRVVWRRDYTKAIVLYRMTVYNAPILWFDEYAEYDLGGTYRSLSADGRLGEPVNTIRLRANEGAILLKAAPPPDPLADVKRHLAAAKAEIETVQQLLDEPIVIGI